MKSLCTLECVLTGTIIGCLAGISVDIANASSIQQAYILEEKTVGHENPQKQINSARHYAFEGLLIGSLGGIGMRYAARRR